MCPGRHGGAQPPVQLLEAVAQRGAGRGDVARDLVVQLGPGPGDVVAHESDGVAGMADVVGPHPLDQSQVVGVVPPQVVALELLPHDLPGVSLAVQHVVVQSEAGAPAGLQGEGAEPLRLHEVAEDAVLQGEELVRAVRGLAHSDDAGVADHALQGAQVARVAAGLGGTQRVGGPVQGPDDRRGGPGVRAGRRRGACGRGRRPGRGAGRRRTGGGEGGEGGEHDEGGPGPVSPGVGAHGPRLPGGPRAHHADNLRLELRTTR